MTNSDACTQLDECGFVLLPGVMDADFLNTLRSQVEDLYDQEGKTAGAEFRPEPGTRRLANLVNKGRVFQDVIMHASVMSLVGHVLHGSVKLSSLNARSANPFSDQPQPLHCDMGALPDQNGNWVCNAVWMLDDFTADNGALRVVPGSHRWNRLPQDALDDSFTDHPQQQVITGSAGSVIVVNAHLWHGGMANRTANSRRAIHAFYCRRDKPQQQYQKQLLDEQLQAGLSARARELLALDDPLNDELTRQNAIKSGFLAVRSAEEDRRAHQ